MNKRQQRRAEVLGRLASGAIRKVDAENLLGLTGHTPAHSGREYGRLFLA